MTRPWTLIALARRETVGGRLAALAWTARAETIVAQLRVLRGTYPGAA